MTLGVAVAHRVGSRLRHSRLLESQGWLWRRVEPGWERAFAFATTRRGYPTVVNGDPMRLTYRYAARYDRDVYEPIIHRALVERLTPGMTGLDVGAHVGLLAISAAQRVGPAGRTVTFEPAPATHGLLARHVRLNGLEDRLEVVPAVVSDRNSEASLFVFEDSMSASLGRRNIEALAPQEIHRAEEVRLPCVTLDSFCAERDLHPDLIKIDVEGAEVGVLRGAKRVLAEDRPLVLCEVHPQQLGVLGDSVEEFDQVAESWRYVVNMLDEPNRLGIWHQLLTPAERSSIAA